MRVVTYWQELAPHPTDLMAAWQLAWEDHGFEVVITGLRDAQHNERYEACLKWAQQAPTRNQKEFEVACWMRWLAYQQYAPALFVDYDCINFDLKPERVPVGDFINLGCGTVYATWKGIQQFIDFWPRAKQVKVEGDWMLSDIYALQQFWDNRLREHMLMCVVPGRPGAQVAPLVHFGNAWVKPEHRHNERWRAVEEFRQQRGIEKCATCGSSMTGDEVCVDNHGLPCCRTCFDGQSLIL